jgi:hypothetical protein
MRRASHVRTAATAALTMSHTMWAVRLGISGDPLVPWGVYRSPAAAEMVLA